MQTILDNADDDASRLVYADWLEESGQVERAEFIRCQLGFAAWSYNPGEVVRWAGGTVSGAQAGAALARAQALEREHRATWFPQWDALYAGIKGLLSEAAVFERGFVYRVICCGPDWLRNADAILAVEPVQQAYLLTMPWPWIRNRTESDVKLKQFWPSVKFFLSPGLQWADSALNYNAKNWAIRKAAAAAAKVLHAELERQRLEMKKPTG